jgi:hypothetical protein
LYWEERVLFIKLTSFSFAMRLTKQGAAQLAVGINLTAIAVGLPLVWNYVVKQKWDEWRANNKRDTIDPTTLLSETLAVEMLVNERRKERGLQPYVFSIQNESGIVSMVLQEHKRQLYNKTLK